MKNRITAWMLWIFLGWFGIHSFYLGRKEVGCIQIFLSILVVLFNLYHAFLGLIPGLMLHIVLLIDAVQMDTRVNDYNKKRAIN